MSIQVAIDPGIPGSDNTAEITFKYSADGSIHILAFKVSKPMKPKNGYNMPEGVFPNDIPGFNDDEEDQIIQFYCEQYTPDIDGVCLLCGEPLTQHDD